MVNRNLISLIGLLTGIIILIIFCIIEEKNGLSRPAWITAGVAIMMTIWWITEAVPIYVTGVLPLILFPLLGVFDVKEIANSYAHPLVLLFLGGFIIASAMEASGLHKRIAIKILSFSGTSPSKIIAGFMITTSLLSMWVSNTASTIMMLPIVVSVITIFDSQKGVLNKNFGIPLLLSVAYAASIGGTATLIGTPTNIMLASILSENYNYEISFIDWFLIGFPITFVMIPLVWFFICKIIFKVSNVPSKALKETISKLRKEMGKLNLKEKLVAIVFAFTAFSWIFRKVINDFFSINLNDTSIGLLGALLLFMLPVKKNERVCNWETANKIPWGVLLLVGGGISLSKAFNDSGLVDWIGSFSIYFNGFNVYFLIIIFVFLIIFLTELNSNTATVATFTPILIIFAIGLEVNPLYFVIPTTIAASCAFMLPIATPPNAVIFGSGRVQISDMIRTGVLLNMVSIVTVSIVSVVLLNYILGFSILSLPDWAIKN
ncbi:MAG: anion transporter [Rickettsiales bacterium]|nr:anion transporter [Rickettsiales bacterium]